jgi:hypothetical protein
MPNDQVTELAAQVAAVIQATDVWQFLSQVAKDHAASLNAPRFTPPPAPPPVDEFGRPLARMSKGSRLLF